MAFAEHTSCGRGVRRAATTQLERRGARSSVALLLAVMGLVAAGCGAPSGSETASKTQVVFVELAPEEPEVFVGGSLRLEAYPTDEKGEDLEGRRISWWSGDPKVATVDQTGLVQGVSVGRTVIAVDVDGVQAGVLLRVLPAPIGRIALEPDALDLYQGRWTRVVARAIDIWGQPVEEVKGFEWRSSDPSVATVDETGRVDALQLGTATIFASVDDLEGSASVTVRAPRATLVEAEVNQLTIHTGRSRQLSAIAFDELKNPLPDAALSWRSDDPQIASVDREGTVRAWRPGETEITVSAGTAEAKIEVRVLQMEARAIELFPKEASVVVGEELLVTPTVIGSDGDPVYGFPIQWSSSDPSIATVTSLGQVSAHAIGEAAITAAVGSVSASARVVVKRPPPFLAAVLVEEALWVREGRTVPFPVKGLDQYGEELEGIDFTYGSSSPQVATVVDGKLYGWSSGQAIITTSARSVSAKTIVNVLPDVELARVEILLLDDSLILGEGTQAAAVVYDTSGERHFPWPITWSTSDPSVATVEDGAITGVRVGEVTITATAEGISDSVVIRVEALRLVEIDVADRWSCGLTADGRVYCWGSSPLASQGILEVPTRMETSLRFRQISVGDRHLCGITQDDRAHCMGDGREGQLGAGVEIVSGAFVSVAGEHRFRWISAGDRQSCGVTLAGEGYCWGSGLLGTGEGYQRSLVPVPVGGDLELAEIHVSNARSAKAAACALTTEGRAHCWGENASGELGDGSTTPAHLPRAVAGDHHFAAISLSAHYPFGSGAPTAHGCALDPSGRAYCWGDNASGQLGDGTQSASTSPRLVAGGERFQSISVRGGLSGSLSCGITQGGAAKCWGTSTWIAFADGSKASPAPAPIPGGHTFTSIRLAGAHACALDTAGLTHCWGLADGGRLGVRTDRTSLEVPTPVFGQLPPAP